MAVCHIIPILVQEDKALVAVPGPAWSRTAAGRYLPKGTLSKAVLLEVAAAEEDIEGLGGETVKIWMGFLHSEVEASFHPGESDEPGALGFGEGSNERLPAPEALLSAATEHFAFQTAQSAPVELSAKTAAKRKTKVDMEKRVLKLENSLEDIKALLTDLPKQLQQPSKTKTAPSTPSPALPLGLDPGVVAAAQAAGVPEEQIRKIGGLMQRPNRMVEVLGSGTAHPTRNELSETEDEEEVEVQEEKGGAVGPVEKAVVQLTKLMSDCKGEACEVRLGRNPRKGRVWWSRLRRRSEWQLGWSEQGRSVCEVEGSPCEASRLDQSGDRATDGGGLQHLQESPWRCISAYNQSSRVLPLFSCEFSTDSSKLPENGSYSEAS